MEPSKSPRKPPAKKAAAGESSRTPSATSAAAYNELERKYESLVQQVEECRRDNDRFRRDNDQFRRDNDQLRREKASWESQLILLSGVDAINNVLQHGFENLITQLQPLDTLSSQETDLDTGPAARFAAIQKSLARVEPDSYRFVRNDADIGFLNDPESLSPASASQQPPTPAPTHSTVAERRNEDSP